MDRPHPPSPRRRALARAAGRVLTSPALAAALALAAGTGAAIAVIAARAPALVTATRDQLARAADGDAATRGARAAAALPLDVLALVLPIVAIAALAALGAQAALGRGLWLPRRDVAGAPTTGAEPATAGDRAIEAAIAVARGLVVLGAGVGALLARLPRLADLPRAASPAAALGAAVAGAVATAAIAAVAAAALEVAWRQLRLGKSLAMTRREWQDDARASHGDPQVRRARRDAARDDRALVAAARAVIVGDGVAVALAWTPGAPPAVSHRGRGLAAHRLRNAARAAGVPLHADPALAERLAAHGGVPDDALAAVADVLVACGVRPA